MARELSLLIAELNHTDASSRISAAEELARLGDKARGAAVSLVRAAGDEEEVCEWVVAALEELGPPSAADLSALAELAAQSDDDVAYWATTLLGRLGEQAGDAVPALCAALGAERALHVRERAAWALGRIGPAAGDAALDVLTQAANDSQPRLARVAAKAVEQVSGR